ncbi:MAG TPA: WD40 repeat domain-containing protein [Ktedonobacteraceae bacterium]|jgi:WD40 repeat protein|nr:WD40 repeat domain-containing protein [Ktedonobacteraceae bacterium]
MEKGTCLVRYQGHQKEISALAWSSDGRFLASVSREGVVHVWEAMSGRLVRQFGNYADNAFALAWSPDGEYLASCGGLRSVRENQVDIWQPHSGHLLWTYRAFEGEVSSLAWTRNSDELAIGCWDSTVHLWNRVTGSGQILFTTDTNPDFIYAVSWSPGEDYLAVATDEGQVVVLRRADKWQVAFTARRSRGGVNDAQWAPHQTWIASVGSAIQVWEAFSGTTITTYAGHAGSVRKLCWSPNGCYLASADSDHTVHIWEAATGRLVQRYEGYEGCIKGGLGWLPDGTALAWGNEAKEVEVWDVSFLAE